MFKTVDIYRSPATKLALAVAPIYFLQDRIHGLKDGEIVTFSMSKEALVHIVYAYEEYMRILSDDPDMRKYTHEMAAIHSLLENENMLLHRPDEYDLPTRIQSIVMEFESRLINLRRLRDSMEGDNGDK